MVDTDLRVAYFINIMKRKNLFPAVCAILITVSGLALYALTARSAFNRPAQARRVILPVRHAAVKPAAFFVVLQDAFQRKHLWTQKISVRRLLQKNAIALSAMDRVYPGLDASAYPGLFVKIVRVTVKKEKRVFPVPFQTVVRDNPHMLRSQKKVLKDGKAGTEERVTLTYYKNGLKTASSVLSKRIVHKPENRIVMMGSAFVLASRYSPVTSNPVTKLSEDKLKTSVTSSKTPLPETKTDAKLMVMSATAYTPFYCGGSKSGKTATGIKAKKGVVAVDPRVIPLGTKLYIPGYGYALAADTGSAIKGKRIDLCFNTRKEVSRFGRKKIKVYILK